MLEREHPIRQDIRAIQVAVPEGTDPWLVVGQGGVTHIEATTTSGLHADIAYVRVWSGEFATGEFCQHNLLGLYFFERAPAPKPDAQGGR